MSLSILLCMRRRRRRNRIKRKVFLDRENPFEINDHVFFRRYRFPKACVIFLIDKLSNDLVTETNRSKAIPPHLIVTTALSLMGSGCLQNSTGQNSFQNLQQATVSRIFSRFLKAFNKNIVEFIKFPKTTSEINETKLGFFNYFNFPNVLGIIDGIQFEIQKPSILDADKYRNRNGNYSINVQGICNSNHIFTDVVCHSPGSTSNSNIYTTSPIYKHLHSTNVLKYCYLLGDNNYPLDKCLLTPINKPKTKQELKYNDVHKKTHRLIKLSFGILKNRFPILNKMIYSVEKCEEIILCCFMLNNFAILNNIYVPGEFIIDERDDDDQINEIQVENELGTVIRHQLINYYFK